MGDVCGIQGAGVKSEYNGKVTSASVDGHFVSPLSSMSESARARPRKGCGADNTWIDQRHDWYLAFGKTWFHGI